MAVIKGPFNLVWGKNMLTDVESVDLNFEMEGNDYNTMDGRSFSLQRAISASATISLLASDAVSLAPIIPQFAKLAGSTMTSGEVVEDGTVAIDMFSNCEASEDKYDLDIISCNDPSQVLRLKACSTSVAGVNFENSQTRVIEITFTGEPDSRIAAYQIGESKSLVDMDFNHLFNRPSYDSVTMTGDTSIPKVSNFKAGENISIGDDDVIVASDLPDITVSDHALTFRL